MTMLSRSEITALSKKATRGAGFSWGLAEEAGSAVVGLYENGFDGFACLVEILKFRDESPIGFVKNCGLTWGVYTSDLSEIPRDMPESLIGLEIFNFLCGSLDSDGESFWPKDAPKEIYDFAQRTYVPESETSREKGAG